VVKKRFFKAVNAEGEAMDQPQRKQVGPIAHDVVALYTLAPGQAIKFLKGGEVVWQTSQLSGVASSIEIEILAGNESAIQYYVKALPPGRTYYWVPNQGDPPPMM